MKIAQDLLDQIIDHARADAPNECCGLVGARDGRAVSVHRATNLAASPLKFEVDGPELFRLLETIEEGEGGELGAIYHSHTRTDPYPSQTDINFSVGWPGTEWLIVGLKPGSDEATVRSYLIEDGQVREVAVEVA